MADKKIMAGIFATILASLCCVTPILAILAGSSSLASSFSWMEPYHNYLVGLTVLILLYAWWDKLKPKTDAIDCACDEKAGFFSSKKFLAIVTVFSIIMLTFPQWGYSYFETEEACETCVSEPKAVAAETEDETEAKIIATEVNAQEESKELFVLKYINEEKANPSLSPAGPACSGIGYKEADDLMFYAKQEVKEVSATVLKKMLDNGEDVVLLDVREADQRSEGEIYADESYVMTRGNLEFRIMNMIKNKDAVIVAYCRSGGRSLFAAQTLNKLGYKNAYNLKGGLKEWALSGYPFENGLGIVVKVEAE